MKDLKSIHLHLHKGNPLPSNEVIDDGEVVVEEDEDDSSTTETIEAEEADSESVDEASSKSNTITQTPASTKVATAQSSKVAAETKNQTYTVRPGDTLYSISMQHYGTRLGEEKIKVANDLASNEVMVNETLIIPY
jgi:type IV pilus assembly protein PilO